MSSTVTQPHSTDNPAAIAPDRCTTRPLKICTIAYSCYETDARVMRYNKELAARGDVVDVITLRGAGRPKRSVRDGITVIGVQTRQVNEHSPLSHLTRVLRFFVRAMFLVTWRQLRIRYDVVHVHSVPEFLIFAAWLPKLMGAKLIVDIHDLLPELYASKFQITEESALFKVLLSIERASVAFSDHLITANDLWHKKLMVRAAAAQKATTLLNFPDRSIFFPRHRTRSDGKFIVIYPGSLNWHQGLDLAIEAFASARDRMPNAEFHIYGVGPARTDLERLVQTRGLQNCVYLRDPLPLYDIASVMASADLGVVPKRKDGFGNEAFSTKSLEFMAVGVPVIVSDTAIDTHYFDDSLVRFFKSGHVDDLAARMLELFADRVARETLIHNGLQFVRMNSWDMKKGVYLDLVDTLVTGRPRKELR